jgi:hypothetical protein
LLLLKLSCCLEIITRVDKEGVSHIYSFLLPRIEYDTIEGIIPITTYAIGDNFRIDGQGEAIKIIEPKKELWVESITCHIHGQIQDLEQSFRNHKILIMSDASLVEGVAAAARIVTTEDSYKNDQYIWGEGVVPTSNCDSHRAECYGILGGVYTWQKYKKLWDIDTDHNINFMCDNKSAINFACNSICYPNITSRIPDFDVLKAIRYFLQRETFNYQHVKGHQDDRPGPLDIYAQLNVHADYLASKARDNIEPGMIIENNLQDENWSLVLDGNKVVKNIDDSIREHIHQPKIKEFWNKKERIASESFTQVAWDSMKKVMDKSSVQTKHWIVKQAVGECAANAVMFQRRERERTTNAPSVGNQNP